MTKEIENNNENKELINIEAEDIVETILSAQKPNEKDKKLLKFHPTFRT